MEDVAPAAVEPGLFDAARHPRGRSRSGVTSARFARPPYDPASGKEIWRVSYPDGFSNVPRPVFGHGLVFLATGFNEPTLMAVRADGKGDVDQDARGLDAGARRAADAVAAPRRRRPLYRERRRIATALDARTGKRTGSSGLAAITRRRRFLPTAGSTFRAKKGLTTVIAPGTAFKPPARNELDGATLASMAVSGGSIFIRTDTHLYRIGSAAALEPPRVAPTRAATSVQATPLVRPAAWAQAAPPAQAILDRAMIDFANGRIEESIRGFDEVAKLAPRSAPQLWQRGIALSYAGRYRDCRQQFEEHRQVNPNDVENAAWHFICVARGESVRVAREDLLPVGADPRVPMRQIYDLLRDSLSPQGVIAAAKADPGHCSSRTCISGCTSKRPGTRRAPSSTSPRRLTNATPPWGATCTPSRACTSGFCRGRSEFDALERIGTRDWRIAKDQVSSTRNGGPSAERSSRAQVERGHLTRDCARADVRRRWSDDSRSFLRSPETSRAPCDAPASP